MNDLHADIERMLALDAEGRHGELLAFLQGLYGQAEAAPAPASTDYFMTLFQWQLLIEKYAPAADALAQARDEQVRNLLAGERYTGTEAWPEDHHRIFERVQRIGLIVRMNDILGDPHATHALFLQLEARHPELAHRYAWRALPAIVEVGDFALADRYRGDPLALLTSVNATAARSEPFPPDPQAPRLAADLMNLTQAVRIGITVLRGLGRDGEAQAVRDDLLRGLANEELRALAERELEEPGTISRRMAERQMALQEAARPSAGANQASGAGRPNR